MNTAHGLIQGLTLTPDAPIDLHMHTTYSDGQWPAEQLVDYLVKEQYALVAITDHDRVDKVADTQALAAHKNLAVLAGVEMSTQWRGKMGDLLCYGFSTEKNELLSITERIVQLRIENTYAIYNSLKQKGYDFPRQQEVLARTGGEISYPYEVGILLREHGYASSWSMAMQILREHGYHAIRVDMAETVEAAHRSGAVCLIAHPGRREGGFTFYDPALLDQVRAEIPLDGIEVRHPSHKPEMVEIYQEYVKKHNLLGSTGSDSHCTPSRMPMKYAAHLSRQLLERVGIQVQS